MKCKFPDKPCKDSYRSENEHKRGVHCRLMEWKKKRGVCPYDSKIQSHMKIKKNAILEGQKLLEESL